MRSSPSTLAVALSLLAVAGGVRADADAEREVLARLSHEIEALAPLIEEAEARTDQDARIRFHYEWLRQDLDRVRLGIAEHLAAPRNQPREIEPLRGDYRQ
jgi:RAQPRD family integrative conjugative element protein